MNVLAAESHTFWEVALVLGLVVVVLVFLLMRRLVSFLKDFEARALAVAESSAQLRARTAPLEQLTATGLALAPDAQPPAPTEASAQAAPAAGAGTPDPSITREAQEPPTETR